jgi:hypothetical protein
MLFSDLVIYLCFYRVLFAQKAYGICLVDLL